ncbi:MAG TPA: tRNA pseudouridine(38-40) synthase TruA [Syntrophales bacterium]|nr:tRNA pseudouridine(38-40) synthase TruA [Syntrophales bacterium]
MAGAKADKYRLTLEYDGGGYRGWQTQENARSVQGTLLRAAAELFGSEVDIQGAGRTDAGVHALGQVAHLAVKRSLPPPRIKEGLNDLLPATINILKVERVPPDWHARHDAVGRIYIYIFSRVRNAFGKRYAWWVKEGLNAAAMRDACRLFAGFHDFASFADRRLERHVSTKVRIAAADIEERGELIIFRVAGSHFLWKMVRRLAGVLAEVGRGNLTGEGVAELLVTRSELPARLTAPPAGLFLAQVLYPGEAAMPLVLPPPLMFAAADGRQVTGRRQDA